MVLRKKFAGTGFLILGIAMFAWSCTGKSKSQSKSPVTPRPVALAGQIRNLERDTGGRFGVYAKNLVTGEEISYHAAEIFPTASSIKLPVLVEFYDQVGQGQIDPQQTTLLTDERKWGGSGILQYYAGTIPVRLEDAARLMIIVSDNTATNLVIDALGKSHTERLTAVNAKLTTLGLKNTRLLNRLMDWSTKTNSPESIRYGVGMSTPADMGLLLEKIVAHTATDSAGCETMLGILKHQFYADIIPRFLPGNTRDITVYHKTGSVTETRVDVGYVTADSIKYVIALFADQFRDHAWTNQNEAVVGLAKISRLVWNHFTGDSGLDRQPVYSQDYYPYPSGEWLRLRLHNGLFPHPDRAVGYTYDNKFYSADEHYRDSTAVVIIPEGFHEVDGKVDLVVHFHGWNNDAVQAMGDFHIPQQLNASGKNAIFVIAQGPYQAPDSFGGKMEDPGGFTAFVNEILGKLKKINRIQDAVPGRIILSAHSGGYRALAKVLANGDLASHIRELFLFDAFYGLQENYLRFAQNGGTLRSIYTQHLADEHRIFYHELDSLGIPYSKTWNPAARVVLYPTRVTHNQVLDGTLAEWLKASLLDTISPVIKTKS